MLRAIGASLEPDKAQYFPGEFATFSIVGAKPGSRILWTTWKNGEVIEQDKSRGEVIGGNGTAELAHPAFTGDDLGYWQKQAAIVNDADGSRELVQSFFTVSQAMVVPAMGGQSVAPAGFFDQTINIMGANIPTWLALAVGIGIAYKVLNK